jgi:hypothetical protein
MLGHFAAWDDERGDAAAMAALFSAHVAIVGPWLTGAQRELLAAVGARLSADACAQAEERLAAAVGARTLVAKRLPTRYAEEYFQDDLPRLLHSYDRSVAFWRELVEVEGRSEHAPELREAEANRARVARLVPPEGA